ncbi:unnamed protein product [Polarella glacialis]|uniref:Uncharacterized protein n=1 Tax=Polarella glacialis TaxID=89957 RepID=A0A813L8Q4_POLGL|nr:unnamed protein product [Polarella glacialis]CAE8721782.1 unnamed protein product [Polarella glacialis]
MHLGLLVVNKISISAQVAAAAVLSLAEEDLSFYYEATEPPAPNFRDKAELMRDPKDKNVSPDQPRRKRHCRSKDKSDAKPAQEEPAQKSKEKPGPSASVRGRRRGCG